MRSMDYLLTIIQSNYEWFFSGIGVFILSCLLFWKKRSGGESNKVNQRNINSRGDVVGRDKKS